MVGLLMDVWRNSIRKKWDLPHFKQPKLEKIQNPVVPGPFKGLGDPSLPYILDRLDATVERFSHFRIRPRGTVRIRFEQNLCSSDLLRSALEFLDNVGASLTFLIDQPDNIFFVHGKPPCCTKSLSDH